MLRMMLRPRWIAALLLTLGVAATFAGLAQWQISRAATDAIVQHRPTELVQQLSDVLQPGVATPQKATGQRFETAGRFIADDTVWVANRIRNVGDTTSGWWVVGHFITEDRIDIPVVLGWAPSSTAAREAARGFDASIAAGTAPTSVTGRFLPSDAPELPKGDSQSLTTVAVGQLVNVWRVVGDNGAYFGYLISEDAPTGLAPVSTPAPEQQAQLNFLNLFYGLEWATFAGFAIYLWWRLVRDAVERERELEAESGAPAEPEPTTPDR